LRAQAIENLKKYRWEPTPYIPAVRPSDNWLAAINVGNTVGGINWPGASFDPETGIFYGQANNSSVTTEAISDTYFNTGNPEAQAKNRIPIWEAEPPPNPEGRGRGFGRGFPGAAGGGGRAGERADAAQQRRACPPEQREVQGAAAAGGRGGRGGLTQGTRRTAVGEAAVRRADRDRSQHRHDQVQGSARRHTGCGPRGVRTSRHQLSGTKPGRPAAWA
jgi:hypothetical protein